MTDLVCVDVDGTLTEGSEKYWTDGECVPNQEMVEHVNEMYKNGHHIVIWTARPYTNAEKLAAWLDKHGVRYHGIRMDKGSADVYVDDKAVRPEAMLD